MRRLTLTDTELAATAEALREVIGAELAPNSEIIARGLPDRIDAKLPSAIDHHPAGPATGRLLAGDGILRLPLGREDRYSHAALTNETIAAELEWKPAGTSVRELLDDLCRSDWLITRGSGPERQFALTRKGRGRARALQHGGTAAPDGEARISEPNGCLTSSTPTARPARSASATTSHSASPGCGTARPCRPPPAWTVGGWEGLRPRSETAG